jgi:hypothetical protein
MLQIIFISGFGIYWAGRLRLAIVHEIGDPGERSAAQQLLGS